MGWKDDDGKWAKWKRFNAFNIVWNQIKEHHLCQLSRLMQRQNIAIESLNCDTMRNACDHSAKEGVEQRYRERERVEVYLLSQYDKRAKCTCFFFIPILPWFSILHSHTTECFGNRFCFPCIWSQWLFIFGCSLLSNIRFIPFLRLFLSSATSLSLPCFPFNRQLWSLMHTNYMRFTVYTVA